MIVTRGQILLAASPTTPFKSVKDVIDYAKQNPGKLLNASSSNGSPGHVDGELFKFMTGTDIVHVPYKGGAAAINDLIAGRVQLMFESLNSIAPFAKSGAVRALAVTGDHRSPAFPDLPTIAEAGVPGYSAESWTGVIAPAGMPQPIIDKLNAAMNKAIQSDAFKARIAQIGDDVAGGTPRGIRHADRQRVEEVGRGDPTRRHQDSNKAIAPERMPNRACAIRAFAALHLGIDTIFPLRRNGPYRPQTPKQRDPAKHSKKDPAKPTRAKASRPEMPALDPSLAEILNPAIGQGRAGLGAQTGIASPARGRRKDRSQAAAG